MVRSFFTAEFQITTKYAGRALMKPIYTLSSQKYATLMQNILRTACLEQVDIPPNIGVLTGMFLYIGKHESFLQ